MDYEKKYKDTLERAKKLYERGTITESLGYVFPELKESEDEKIRKFLIEDIKDTLSSEDFKHYNPEHTKKLEEAIAWLEKQGEKKPALSEEDEEHIDSLLKRLDGLCRNEFERTRFAINEDGDWLKSLKQRIGG